MNLYLQTIYREIMKIIIFGHYYTASSSPKTKQNVTTARLP